MLVIATLRRQEQEDLTFEVSLDYIVSSKPAGIYNKTLKKTKKEKEK
jgi:hypothetical protein